jgi:hypothetical protein
MAFRLPAQVLGAPGGLAETRIAGIRMSPSKPGMGEMKLSKACIQTIKV